MPLRPSRVSSAPSDAISRTVWSWRSRRQFQPTAPSMWPFSYAAGSTSTSTRRTPSSRPCSAAHSVETRAFGFAQCPLLSVMCCTSPQIRNWRNGKPADRGWERRPASCQAAERPSSTGSDTEAGGRVDQPLGRPHEVRSFLHRVDCMESPDRHPNSQNGPVTVRLIKYQALGNDYLVLDLPAPLARIVPLLPRICDRHLGPGSDGLLAFDAQALSIRIFNPDSSEAQKSGNGLRIAAAHAVLEHGAPAEFELGTPRRANPVRIVGRAGAEVISEVDIGP